MVGPAVGAFVVVVVVVVVPGGGVVGTRAEHIWFVHAQFVEFVGLDGQIPLSGPDDVPRVHVPVLLHQPHADPSVVQRSQLVNAEHGVGAAVVGGSTSGL